jgi:pyruvate/2-oxoglutarate dehydrogenase complex dihydrolipoamide acyltransferase (E2) component
LATAGAQPLRKTHPDAAELLAAHLIAECGRLLRKFPHLNAYCSGDEVHFYERVNVGYALDAGRGLKVPVFRDADLKEPETILQERREFIEAYLNNRLSPGALAGGTFSITDLSGSGVVQFEPLIVEGQAAILGVGANFLPATRPGVAYNLTLAFDHRLIEGRAAARFLNELKERMLAHEEGPARAAFEPDAPEPKCALCGMDRQQAASHKHFLVSTAGPVPGNTHWICTVCLQGR